MECCLRLAPGNNTNKSKLSCIDIFTHSYIECVSIPNPESIRKGWSVCVCGARALLLFSWRKLCLLGNHREHELAGMCAQCVFVFALSQISLNVYPWLCVYLPISADMHALTQTHTHTLFTAGFIFSTCLLYNQGDTGENIDSLPLLPPHSWFGYLCVLYADETEVFLVAYFWCSNDARESLCACRSELLNIDEKMLHKYNQYARTPHRHTTLRHSHTECVGGSLYASLY